jgi:hypothetical protein
MSLLLCFFLFLDNLSSAAMDFNQAVGEGNYDDDHHHHGLHTFAHVGERKLLLD